MIRIIARSDDATMAANVGGSVETTWRTYDIECPELEMFLRRHEGDARHKLAHAQVIGVEVIP